MTTSNFNEFEGSVGTEFFPFDDSRERSRYLITSVFNQSGSGMDTSAFDQWRQGVEITNPKYLYGSNQPKLWVGNLKHLANTITYGQPRSWTEFLNTASYDDLVIEFNPIQYITEPGQYPYPIYFNGGPQEDEEARLEPFTLSFRSDPIEGLHPVRCPKANLEDGNCLDGEVGNNRIVQFIEYSDPLVIRYFLDAGEEYYGAANKDTGIFSGIRIEGFVPFINRLAPPFNDTNDEAIVSQVLTGSNSSDLLFGSQLKRLKMELDEDIRENYSQKSAPAGYSVYGPSQAKYNTDSVAFLGLLRGS